jgi:glutamate-1-semialdehyde 2,1-aminomutase
VMPEREHSARLYERALQVIPGGVHSPVRAFRGVGGQPVFVERAEGPYLYDVDNNRYLDFCMSWGPLIFGHADPDIAAAAHAAIDHGCSYGTAEQGSLHLAELITGEIPWIEKIRFVNSGTEAVMSAIRIARGATGRSKILKFAGCYHGHSDGMLVAAGSGLADMTVADSAGVTTGTAADTLVAPLDDLPAVEQLFALHGNDIAAVIIEPLPANNGLLPQREGYLQQLLEIAHAYNALVIFDEVITGFRLAFGGAAAFYDVTPDLVTYGKIIGGGFPVGAFGGRADLMDQVAPVGPVYQAGTLSGNPVAMAAGLAALRKLLRNKPWDTLAGRNAALCRNIQAIPANKRHPDEIRLNCVAVASLFWISVGAAASGEAVVRTQHQVSPVQKNLFPALFHGLLDRGHYLSPSAFESGFLSTSHDDSDLDNFVQATADTLAQLDGAE